jgi:HlyD family secretion protein
MSLWKKINWRWMTIALGVLALIVASVLWFGRSSSPAQRSFRTETVRRGELLATVSATGTIEPEEVVDVGAQVVGMIREFGPDPSDSSKPVDYMSHVEPGSVLVRIDDALYQSRLEHATAVVGQSESQVEQDRANLRRAEADKIQMQSKLHLAQRDLTRAKAMLPSRSISEQEYDAFESAYETAKANLDVAEAAVDQAKATLQLGEKTVAVARADRREAQQNLDYTVIRSPVKGVIVDRRVNVGQTVVSSLSAPSLFLIAKDLSRLQVWVSVNEADDGRLRIGQPVRFTVDAFPDEVFRGEVGQIRLNATMTQNVVTYTVVVSASNPSGKLLPYLTASVQFEVGRRSNVLMVPNAALRWQPQVEQIAPEFRAMFTVTDRGKSDSRQASSSDAQLHNRGWVWIELGRFVRPIEVRIGLTDGIRTEITGDISEGVQVVVSENLPSEGEEATSPFTPQIFGGGRR